MKRGDVFSSLVMLQFAKQEEVPSWPSLPSGRVGPLRGRLTTPVHARLRPHSRHTRAYAVRKPREHPIVAPGDLVQVDSVHLRPLPGVERRHFTAVDIVSRWSACGVRATATAGAARAFLADLRERLPFPIRPHQALGYHAPAEFLATLGNPTV